ncbi:MAG: hypothetical protein SOX90_10160 [Candidatus Fimadaptatus sp.]|nr:hypothetical protein [Candidatus Fimadaptatus sp.]
MKQGNIWKTLTAMTVILAMSTGGTVGIAETVLGTDGQEVVEGGGAVGDAEGGDAEDETSEDETSEDETFEDSTSEVYTSEDGVFEVYSVEGDDEVIDDDTSGDESAVSVDLSIDRDYFYGENGAFLHVRKYSDDWYKENCAIKLTCELSNGAEAASYEVTITDDTTGKKFVVNNENGNWILRPTATVGNDEGTITFSAKAFDAENKEIATTNHTINVKMERLLYLSGALDESDNFTINKFLGSGEHTIYRPRRRCINGQ